MTKKLTKILRIFVLCSLILVISTSCSKKESMDKSPSIEDLNNELKETVDLSNMDIGDEEKLKKLYDIDSENLEEYILYIPKSNIEANEIAIFKVKESEDLEEVEEKIKDRVEEQATNFKDYLPDEYYLIEKNVLKTKGNYILFAISEDVDKIEKIFDESFK